MIPETIIAHSRSTRTWTLAALPLVLLGGLLFVLMRSGPLGLVQPEGLPPVERLVIERAVLRTDNRIPSALNAARSMTRRSTGGNPSG